MYGLKKTQTTFSWRNRYVPFCMRLSLSYNYKYFYYLRSMRMFTKANGRMWLLSWETTPYFSWVTSILYHSVCVDVYEEWPLLLDHWGSMTVVPWACVPHSGFISLEGWKSKYYPQLSSLLWEGCCEVRRKNTRSKQGVMRYLQEG